MASHRLIMIIVVMDLTSGHVTWGGGARGGRTVQQGGGEQNYRNVSKMFRGYPHLKAKKVINYILYPNGDP